MASIITETSGRRRIEFRDASGKRRRIRLGDMAARHAALYLARVEELVACQVGRIAWPRPLAEFVDGLSPVLRSRFERSGLVEPRERATPTVGSLVTAFRDAADVKKGTAAVYKQAGNSLLKHLGEGRPLADITPLDGERWRKALVGEGLSEATIAKRVKVAKSIFGAAVRWKLLAESPLASLRVGSQRNPARRRFLEADTIRHILAFCNPVWQARLSLLRWGGLRCPSESERLRWEDVDFKGRRITVRATKTERHAHGGIRVIPMFPELVAPLKALKADPINEDWVFGVAHHNGQSLHHQLEKILRRAGVERWPKLFQNLRSTRQTELTRRFGAHVTCAWLGNTERVAADHYLQITDDEFARAVAPDSAPPAVKTPENLGEVKDSMGREGSPAPTALHGTARKNRRNVPTDAAAVPAVAGTGRAGIRAAQARGRRLLVNTFNRVMRRREGGAR